MTSAAAGGDGPAGMALEWLGLAVASLLAGGVNSVAGGGTIISFPVLAALLPPGPSTLVTANATSTIGLWAGAAAAAWAYRGERSDQPPWARRLVWPSVAGAVAGAGLVILLPSQWFDALVPWLILAAAILFAIQPRVAAWAFSGGGTVPESFAVAAQFVVAVYGGYFGAGIGILMLALLGALGVADIHRANAVKNLLATTVNGTAAAVFAGASVLERCGVAPWGGERGAWGVSWPHAAVMAICAVVGGLAGARLARRARPALVRRIVSVIAFALAGYYLAREYH